MFTMLFLSLQAVIKPSKTKHLRNLIALCVLLTPMYSLANDHFSSWSDKTICRLAKATPHNVEYQAESTKRGLSCGGSNKKSISASSQKIAKALAGIDIENDPSLDFFKPPIAPYPTDSYWWGRKWQLADFNNDGFIDILYIGVMRATNFIEDPEWEVTGEVECGNGDKCTGTKPLPSLFLGDADGNLNYARHLLIDNREEPGMSAGGNVGVADYNNDGVLDFYITDPGIQDYNGHRDSYFLSQKDGTWLESSNTHLSHPNFISHNNGTTGDIDNDGDMDVVYTEMNRWERGTSFWCLMNDGTGFLKKRKCGGVDSSTLELADLDGDGDLDALIGSHELGYGSKISATNAITGIVWNDGRGHFSQKTKLPEHKQKFSVVPEVSASDLDNDGDLDIVYSRTSEGDFYVGAVIQIIENLGNKKFKDHGLIILEGTEWIQDIKFRDFDRDGDNDIYLVNERDKMPKTNGTVLLNNGNFNFDIVRPDEALTLFRDGTDSKIIVIRKKHIPTDEEQAVLDEIVAFEAELAEQ